MFPGLIDDNLLITAVRVENDRRKACVVCPVASVTRLSLGMIRSFLITISSCEQLASCFADWTAYVGVGYMARGVEVFYPCGFFRKLFGFRGRISEETNGFCVLFWRRHRLSILCVRGLFGSLLFVS